MAAPFYSTPICAARFEDFDAEVGSFFAALALVTAADPVKGAVARRQLWAVRCQLEATAVRTAAEVARLRGAPLADWPAHRPHLVAVAALLGSVAQWTYDISAAEAPGSAGELGLGWLAQQAGRLGEEATAAIAEIDAALAELLDEVKAEARLAANPAPMGEA